MKFIELGHGNKAIIDDDDFDRVNQYKWYLSAYGYACTSRGRVYLHRFVLNYTGRKVIDHIDRNSLNNQKDNLRICTRSQNIRNSNKRQGSSRYKGVRWHKGTGKWNARITFNYREYHLGLFSSEIAAAKAYDRKAKELFKEYASLNF